MRPHVRGLLRANMCHPRGPPGGPLGGVTAPPPHYTPVQNKYVSFDHRECGAGAEKGGGGPNLKHLNKGGGGNKGYEG